MGDHDDGAPGIGQFAQHHHHLTVERRIQTRGRFVQDQQRRTGQQFQRHRRPLALTAGEPVHPGVGMFGERKFFQHTVDHLLAVGFRVVRRQSQFGGVAEGLTHGELTVQHIVLRHHADAGAQGLVFGVQVATLEGDHTAGGVRGARDQFRQRRFARTGGADECGERAPPRLHIHIDEQLLIALDGEADAVHVQALLGDRLLPMHQRALLDDKVDIADGDDVAFAQHRSLLATAVDEGAVGRAEVLDGQALGGRGQTRVLARGQRIVDDDLVVRGPTDIQPAGRQTVGPRDRRGGRAGADRRQHRGVGLEGHIDVRLLWLRRRGLPYRWLFRTLLGWRRLRCPPRMLITRRHRRLWLRHCRLRDRRPLRPGRRRRGQQMQ